MAPEWRRIARSLARPLAHPALLPKGRRHLPLLRRITFSQRRHAGLGCCEMGGDGWICCWKRKGRIVELLVYYVETNSNHRVVSMYIRRTKEELLSADFKSIVSWIFMGGPFCFGSFKTSGGCSKKTNLRMTGHNFKFSWSNLCVAMLFWQLPWVHNASITLERKEWTRGKCTRNLKATRPCLVG